MTDDLVLHDVRRLHLKLGDVLVIRLASLPTPATVDHISAELKGWFPNNRVLILERDAELEVVEAKREEA